MATNIFNLKFNFLKKSLSYLNIMFSILSIIELLFKEEKKIMWEQHREHTRLPDFYLCFRPLGEDSGVSGSQCSFLWNEREPEDRVTSSLLDFGVCVAFK